MKKIITSTKELYIADNKVEQAKQDLMALHDPRSPCYGDGYYAQSLVIKYGMSLSDLEYLIGRPKIKITWTWE